MPEPTLLIRRQDVAGVLDLDHCIVAVENAFRALATGLAPAPGTLCLPCQGGAFYLKAVHCVARRTGFVRGHMHDLLPRKSLPFRLAADSGRALLLRRQVGFLIAWLGLNKNQTPA